MVTFLMIFLVNYAVKKRIFSTDFSGIFMPSALLACGADRDSDVV
jgi:hypothetical protein